MKIAYRNHTRGFSLIEVMLAVIVLAVGLLALAALQGELFRSGAEAKARANAATIAQQVIEDARTFGFVSAPNAGYTGDTYNTLADDEWSVDDVSGVDFTVERDVIRYRFDAASGTFVENAADPYAQSVPEFKMVRVTVSWTDGNNQTKQVQMADSIAAISPSDVAKIMEGPGEASQGPTVWIEPPNKDNPRAVPIAVGDNQSAASSNPTPEQFIEDVSAVTRFSVMTFTGSASGTEVLLDRKLDVAAASCVCQTGGSSTSTNPAYKATEWNGIELAYQEPETMPVGTPVGTAIVANADSEIEPICTVCCRDHYQTGDRTPAPDPWRAAQGDAVTDHYGYKTQGNSYNIGEGLFHSSETGGIYLEACHLTRVNGRMRMTYDAQQTALVTTPLNAAGTGYRISDFINQFSGYVTTILTEGLGANATMPTGYPSPTAKFPGPSSGANSTYASVVNPASIAITKDEKVNLVSFGVYVDYLNDDTLLAYKCALDGDNDGDCAGLGERDPLSVIPFYAVNVASLGDWSSEKPLVAAVAGATYSNQGELATVGGIVTGGSGASDTDSGGAPVPSDVTITINNSNSGLTGTAAVDLDDQLSGNYIPDPQSFTKTTGSSGGQTNVLMVSTVASSTLKVNAIGVTYAAVCNYSNQTKVSSCDFQSPQTGSQTLTFSNYVTSKTQGQTTTITDRKICLPSDAKLSNEQINGLGTVGETTSITVSNLGAVDYTLNISVVDQASSCPTGLTMTP